MASQTDSVVPLDANNNNIKNVNNGEKLYKLFLLLKEEQMKTRAGRDFMALTHI